MKKRNVFIAGAVLLLIVLVSLLPLIVSNGRVQDLFFSRIADRIPGSLSVAGCSIGWQQGLQCRGLVYDDKAHGFHVTVPELSSEKGLLALIVNPVNLGTVSMEAPVLVFSGTPPVDNQSAGSAENNTLPSVSSPAATQKKSPAADTIPFWDRMIVNLLINEAVVKSALQGDPAEVVVRNGILDASLASGSVHFQLDLESDDGRGTATASGFINLPTRKEALLDTLVTEIKLHVMDLQVKPFLTLLPVRENLPVVTAELSSELLIKATGIHSLKISGTNRLQDVAMAGGVLGEDQPRFEQVTLDLDLSRAAGNSWQFPEMVFSSDFGQLTLKGSYGGRDFTLSGGGRVELPLLFDQFPHLFRVQPETSLQNGALDFTISMENDQQQLSVSTDMVIDNLAGMQQGQPFSWNSPLSLHLDGGMIDRSPQVDKIALKASFLDLVGSGDLQSFSLNGSADLGKAVQQIGTIFQLPWAADGRLHFTAKSKEEGDSTYVVNTRVDIDDFTLFRDGELVMPGHKLAFSGKLTTPGKLGESRADAMDLFFDLSGWPGKINGKLESVYTRSGQVSARYSLQSYMQLGRLTDLFHNLDILASETTLTGSMDLKSSGYFEENRLVVQEFDGRTDDFILYHLGRIYKDSSIHLFTTDSVVNGEPAKPVKPLAVADNSASFFARGGNWNVFDSVSHRIVLRNLALSSTLGSLNVSRFSIEDWQQFPETLSLQLNGKADVGRLTSVLQQAEILPPEQTLTGNGSFAVDLAAKEGKGHTGTVQFDINSLSLNSGEKNVLSDEFVSINTRLQGDLAGRDIDFETFDLKSALLRLQARGRLQSSGKEPHFFLSGKLTPDFSALADLVNSLYAVDIRAAGRQQEQFSLYFPLDESEEDKTSRLRFETRLQADYAAFSGIDLQQPLLPVTMEQGVLQARLAGGLNEGTLSFSPRIDYTVSPPVVTLPDAEQVLTDAKLGQSLSDILKRINPVLGLLARPSGTISVRMDRFFWPLASDGAEQAEFRAVLNVSRVTLVPEGVLHEILTLAGLGDEPLALDQSEIICTAATGRISCTPLKILVAESEMTLAGSVGFDGNIDYLLEVPVTRKLVGREGYRILQGTTLKVPIRGNQDHAVFDADDLARAISDLLGQAAGKAAGKVIEQQVEKILPGLLDGLLGNE